ncbi:hypothetical protein ABG067_008746, partial [Albugo candida]
MSMLRLPTLINFPSLFWSKKNLREDEESSLTSPLLLSEEALVKHHGSIIPLPQEPAIKKESSGNFFSSLKENEVRDELTAILRFSIPLIITFLLSVGNRLVDVWFLGKVGPE